MRISFQHANPTAGNESFLLRFEGDAAETACVLVDAGHDVDVDRLLGPNDHLAAVCLTHAHLDHYFELAGAHRDDVPVFTSPATAAILEDVFDVAGREYDVRTTDTLESAITPIEGWEAVAAGVDVHPVPAGHVPGAVGFLVRVTDGEERHTVLATGDFTARRAAGFPGFDADRFVDVDVLFLTAARNDEFEASLTDGLGTAVEHAHGGARTLVTASGLIGVQCAYLVAAIGREYDRRVPVRVVGQVAKLYEALDYDCPGVEAVPDFEATSACLGPGVVTIAGPEVPHGRSSGRLFGVLRSDPNACVVQLIGSGEDPVVDGACTIHAHDLVNHPTRDTLTAVHDAVNPVQTVVTHRHGGASSAFNDLSSVVWGAGDTQEYTLFDGDQWRLPPWAGGGTVVRDAEQSVQQFAGSDVLDSLSPPPLDRRDDPDLAAEGIDTDLLAELFHQGPDVTADPDVPELTSESTAEPSEKSDVAVGEPSEGSDETSTPNRLFDTIDTGVGGEIDPAIRAAFDEGRLTAEDLAVARAAQKIATGEVTPSTGGVEGSADDDEPATEEDAPAEAPTATDGETEPSVDADGTASPPDLRTDGATASATANEQSTAVSGGEPSADEPEDQCSAPDEPAPDGDEDAGGVELALRPLAVALATREAQTEPEWDSVDSVIVEAVDRYVMALLSGDASGGADERVTLDARASPVLERALDAVADERGDDLSELVSAGLASLLGDGGESPRTVDGLAAHEHYLDAIVQNEAYTFDSPAAVVDAAVVWFVADE